MELTDECKQVLPLARAALQNGDANLEAIFQEAREQGIFIARAQVGSVIKYCQEGGDSGQANR